MFWIVEAEDRLYAVSEEKLNPLLDKLNEARIEFEEPYRTNELEVRHALIDYRTN